MNIYLQHYYSLLVQVEDYMSIKIGRNDKCFCGSGKKYKKCCGNISIHESINSSINEVSHMSNSDEFSMLNEKVNKLKPIMQKYKFTDLVRAVFCINIHIGNRSFIENSLALNEVLITYEENQNLSIKCYEEFELFYSEIEEILAPSVFDDAVINDFGEVVLMWNNKRYKVIIGTGYEQSYGYYQFIPTLVHLNNLDTLYTDLLEYSASIIEFFEDINSYEEIFEEDIPISLKNLFDRTHEYFNQLEKKPVNNELVKFFAQGTSISQMHFVSYNGLSYPLFNTSIIIDFYSIGLKVNSKLKITDMTDLTISKILTNYTKLQNPQKPNVLFPVALVDDKSYLTNLVYSFVFLVNDGIVLAINEERYSEKEITDEISTINKLKQEGNLMFSEVISKNNVQGKIGIKIEKETAIKLFLYSGTPDPTISTIIMRDNNSNYLSCLAVDMIYLLLFMDDINQVSRFYDYKINLKSKMLSFGGISDCFISWKESNEIIEKGAVNYDFISLMQGNSDYYAYEYFKKYLWNYPCGDEESLFNDFHSWNIKIKEDGFFEYVNKANNGFGGCGHTYDNNCFVFFAHNIEFHLNREGPEKTLGLISLIDDLNLRNTKLYSKWFETNLVFSNKNIQFLFMPFDYAKHIDFSGFTEDNNRKYVYSDMYTSGNQIIIRYAVNQEQLYKDLELVEDRSVESSYYLELLMPFRASMNTEYLELKSMIASSIHLPKGVGVKSIPIDYKWSDSLHEYHVDNVAFHIVRKQIAELGLSLGVEPGEYKGQDANRIIRYLQTELTSKFERTVAKYNRYQLHLELLSVYAKILHNINIHKERYEGFDNVDSIELEKIQNKVIKLREDEKHHLRVVEFLIETNLFLESDRGNEELIKKNLEEMLAFSNWVLVLFDTADICYKSNFEKHIEIGHDYVIDIIYSEEILSNQKDLNKRIYDNSNYSLKFDEEDKAFFNKATDSFKIDTGIDFTQFISLLEFMELRHDDKFATEIQQNTYLLDIDLMIDSFISTFEGEIDRLEIMNIIEYITLEPRLLKFWKNQIVNFIPINERENRTNRFNLKPFVKIGSDYIFSPVAMAELNKRWKFGMTDFYLPVEVNFKNTVKSLLKWKKRYEDLFVTDVVQLLEENEVPYIWKEVELHKLDKNGNHPLELGDYDVIAYDKKNQRLWLIECKVLNKVGSIHEGIMQQQNFFLNKKYDEKFKKRIDYFEKHFEQILKAQKIEFGEGIEIIPLMITNKVFFSRYKKIDFDILTLHEFKSLLLSDR